jgi:hypothetical protein
MLAMQSRFELVEALSRGVPSSLVGSKSWSSSGSDAANKVWGDVAGSYSYFASLRNSVRNPVEYRNPSSNFN